MRRGGLRCLQSSELEAGGLYGLLQPESLCGAAQLSHPSQLEQAFCCAVYPAWLFAVSWTARTLGCRINKHGQLMVAEQPLGSSTSVSAVRPSSPCLYLKVRRSRVNVLSV